MYIFLIYNRFLLHRYIRYKWCLLQFLFVKAIIESCSQFSKTAVSQSAEKIFSFYHQLYSICQKCFPGVRLRTSAS